MLERRARARYLAAYEINNYVVYSQYTVHEHNIMYKKNERSDEPAACRLQLPPCLLFLFGRAARLQVDVSSGWCIHTNSSGRV